jgi:hypothetical protein
MDRYHFAGRTAGALAAAALLAAGCSSGGSGNSGGSGGSGGSPSNAASSSGPGNSGSGSTTAAGSALFPVAVGEKWVYADHLGGLGTSTTTNTIKAVKPVSGGSLVTMTDASHILGAPARPTQVTYMFYSDGSISVPFTQLSGGKVTIKSGSIVWPPASVIASGQSHTSVLSVSINTNGHVINEKVHVTVKGGGTQTVTVPAGTYQATVIDQTMAESILGHHVSIKVRTWLAPGVGPVQSELVDSSPLGGGPQVREELKSFTK